MAVTGTKNPTGQSDGTLTLKETDIDAILSLAGGETQPIQQLLALVAERLLAREDADRQLAHQDNVTSLWVRSVVFRPTAP